jgi:predicted AAA+ superfamily ATPase
MLKRKIEDTLTRWKQDPDRLPLIIKGCRQCGKTYSVLEFGKKYYKYTAYFNFVENEDLSAIFEGDLSVDHIIMLMSAYLGTSVRFIPGKTLIILDEIQECPNAESALKFFKIDGRYDVIGTGSLLGIKGYGRSTKRQVPVGYETLVDMYPLDFEEFIWAQGIGQDVIKVLEDAFGKRKKVPEALHRRLKQLFKEYLITGGMPQVVDSFIKYHDTGRVLELQRGIVRLYEQDMLKYAERSDKARIVECFESVPRQLSKENKKFQYSVVRKGGRAKQYEGSIQWIEDAGIAHRCRNLSALELPLEGNAVNEEFKVYLEDTGLLVSMLEDGTVYDILAGNMYTYKGAVIENYLAGVFAKMGRKLYYFRKDSGLEIDFIIRYNREITPVECKAKTGNTKSTRTVLNHPEKYHISMAIKFGDYNVGMENGILTLPLYMAFLIRGV